MSFDIKQPILTLPILRLCVKRVAIISNTTNFWIYLNIRNVK